MRFLRFSEICIKVLPLVKKLLSDKPSSAGKRTKDADTRVLERELSDRLGAPVSIDHSASGKGVLTIRYSDLDQLDGVLRHLR